MEILFPLFLLLPLLFSSLVLSSLAYTLPDKYFINCGSESDVKLSDGRIFIGDRNSNSLSNFSPGQSTPIQDANPSKDTSPLYQTARIYRNPSSYELEIQQFGTYFVRLHFFVFQLPYNLANAQFNVSASSLSLLSNFIVPRNSNTPVIKEFLITLKVGKFSIYFTPSQESSLAFVNAIEVFLAPDRFVPEGAPRVSSSGSNGDYSGLLSDVLHTVHRVNVGGLRLTPENDTLWRSWVPDDSFLANPKAAKNSQFYTGRPEYTTGGATVYDAPDLVYKTAKELNMDNRRLTNFFNITWRFGVNKNYTHLVRVHFCDILSASYNVISFNLYIYSKFVKTINPSERIGPLAAPFYFDFVVDADNSGFLNISIGPREENSNQTAFLNGLEIMELIKESDLVPGKSLPKKKRQPLIVGSVGACVALMCILIAVFLLKRRKTKTDQTLSVPLYGGSSSHRSTKRTASICLATDSKMELKITLAEIQQATKNFDVNLLIGEGGFGKVYRGTLRSGIKVAVKRSEPGHGQGVQEFQTEIIVLSQIRYRHLVSLIGYCHEGSEMILVYEFMEKGTLRDRLYNSNDHSEFRPFSESEPELSWKQRLEICIGSAKGIHYLHTGSAGVIIHRDVKSTNILLDEHYVAKVADFGLSKSSLTDQEHVTMGVKGSFGYLDPEYFISLQLTEKSDVYSFGVVLLEVLCARPAIINSLKREEVNLAEWGMIWHRKGELEKIIDPMLVGKINLSSLRKFGEIAEKCLKGNGAERPTMHDVLYDLEYALQLQQTAEHIEPFECSTTISSLGLPVVEDLPSNCFPVEEDDVPVGSDGCSDTFASELFSS